MDLTSITTPPDWTPDKDFKDFDDRFGEAENYFATALTRVADGYQELIDAADCALVYFERHDHRLVHVHPGTLTLSEKLFRLSTITNTRNGNYKYKDRFGMHLNSCRWVDMERQRIMQSYLAGEEKMWLYPLAELADALGCAAIELEEAMKVEHEDYK